MCSLSLVIDWLLVELSCLIRDVDINT